jgi:ferritin
MDSSLLEAFQHHLTLERQAGVDYFAMAIWFAERGFRGFSRFYKIESGAEQQHAGRLADYLIARAQPVVLEALAAPRQSWDAPEDILTASFQLEADVTASLQLIHGLAERCGDVRSTSLLDPLIDGQVASENQFAHLLGRVRLAQHQPAALLIIDGELAADTTNPPSLA